MTLTTQQRNELRERMQREIDGLEESIARLEQGLNPVAPDAAIGRLSRLDTMLNQGINQSSLSQSRTRLVRLQHALKRIDDPDFGTCAECGEAIPIARLLALPECDCCVECAE
ncbi:TraR/DksA family transcriptional regulator [Oceanidesulfovibrio marinus]|uniref:TraR/DksA family transcriptional regulator n=1 Tax=Oceanidesulfovibrio marinus TaxID=370038 RepID=A0A6P1ZF72_9BACT|nr:TraR/DksA C4-type zinc finger protein [Oceanidesulfovibrio marinus]QJT07843.1 TraR/DksA family transcriptional regulator [Oceanidesulfovibrio marinus]TVM33343.1 TraR/DksA family transcriptional regulator [Oceanidesulfovibrio marinus]